MFNCVRFLAQPGNETRGADRSLKWLAAALK